jgi:hypothetical protein
MKFDITPPSPEHTRHIERFLGEKIDPAQYAKLRGFVAFKVWHRRLQDRR